MEEKITQLIASICIAFTGVRLENGISWQEATILDDYGSLEERRLARNLDEKEDWSQIPDTLIGSGKHQSAIVFLDVTGFKFYLPALMIFTLKHYKTSSSLVMDSLIYRLTDRPRALELKGVLNQPQKACVIQFLKLCLEIGDDYLDLHKVEKRLQRYWVEEGAIELGAD